MNASTTNATFHLNGTVSVNLTDGSIGNVSVYINDEFKGNITLENSKGTLEISTLVNGEYLEVGNHTVVLRYAGDGTYRPIETTAILNVTKAPSRILFNVTTSYYDFIINVTVEHNETGIVTNPNDVTGNVTLNVRGQIINVELVNGSGIGIAYNMPSGAVKIEAAYSGDNNYLSSSNITYENITERVRTLVEITVNAHDIMVDETIYVNVTIICNQTVEGNITVILDNVEYNVTLKNSTGTFNKTGLTAGHKIITAIFAGNETLAPSSGYAHFNVHKYDAFVLIDDKNITHGDEEVITITVPSDVKQGTINVTINGTDHNIYKHILEIINGTVKIDLSNLAVDVYNITAMFESDKYKFTTNSSIFKVSKLKPPIVIQVGNVTYGDDTVITVDVIGADGGNVTLKINDTLRVFENVTLVNDTATFTVKLPAGNYTIDVIYSGDAYDEGNTAKSKFTVYKADPIINIPLYDITYGYDEVVEIYSNAAGNVTIKVDNVVVAENVTLDDNNHTNITIVNPRTGKHTVEVVYSGNDNFKPATKIAEFNVKTMDTLLIIEAEHIPVWNTAYIEVTVENSNEYTIPTAPGNVTININGVNYTSKVINSVAKFYIDNLTVGHKVIWAFYDGDGDLNPSKAMGSFNVYQRTPTVSVTAIDVTTEEDGKITVHVPSNATGYVIVTGNFTNYQIRVDEFNQGMAEIPIGKLANGTYSVHIKYYGEANDNYTTAESDTIFKVSKANMTGMVVNVDNVAYGQKANITVTVPDGTTGNITLKLNDSAQSEITLPIVNNKVTWIVENLAVGNYTVNVTYNGDVRYNINSTSKSFNVTKVTPVMTIDVPDVVDAKTNATIVVRINETATGNITITVNCTKYNATIENGVATFTIDQLLSGQYDIKAEYGGDNNYTAAVPVTLQKGLTVTKVSCYQINVTANDTKVGVNTTIVVKVPIDATGNVSIYIDGLPVENATINHGIALLNVTRPYGNHTVNVTFTDGKYGPRYAICDFWVFKHEVPLVIDVITQNIKVGDNVTVTVTLPTDIKNEVISLEINGRTFTNSSDSNIVTFVIPSVTYGNKTVTVTYGGNNKYVFNSTTANFTVDKRDSQVNVTATGSTVGDNATIRVKVQSNATGYVTVNVNGTNYTIKLNNVGEGSVDIAGLGNGTYYVHATYLGDDQYKPSENNTETFEMIKGQPTITINVDNVVYGNHTVIEISVPGASGNLTIKINNTDKGEFTLVNGKVVFDAGVLVADNYTVYVDYKGDAKYTINSANKDFNVTKATPTISIDVVEVDADTNATVVVHINPETSGTINITVNNKKYSGIIDKGVARIVIDKLNKGSYSVFANYTGDNNFTNASITQSDRVIVSKATNYDMNVSAADAKVGVNTTIIVHVPIDATGNVSIYVNNSFAGNASISQGVATLELNKTIAGKYVINATFGDDKYANKSVTNNYHVIKWDTPIDINVVTQDIKVGDDVTVTVTLPADIKNEVISLEINGIKLTNSSNSNVVTFVIPSVTYGNKTVTVTYGGNNKYVFNSTTANFTVDKRDSQVNVTATGSTVGDNATIRVKVQSNATGYVTVNVNGTNYTIKLNNVGEGSVDIAGLGNGTYYVHATYLGDDQYKPSENNTETFEMTKVQPSFIVNGTNITYGEGEFVTFETAENITGIVKIEIEGKNYTAFIYEGKGNVTVENLAAGDHNVTLYFDGNEKYMNATANNTFNVARAVLPVFVIAQNITYAEQETFIIYVNATGKVDIHLINATTHERIASLYDIEIIDNKYVLPGYLDSGDYTATIDYRGNQNYTLSSASDNFTVAKKDPVITVEVQNITYGDVEHIIVRVNASGNVTIKVNRTEETIELREDNNAIIILRSVHNAIPKFDGKAHEYIYNLNVGEYPVEVMYHGNGNFNQATATALFFVNKDNTTVQVDVADIRVDGKELINVTINNTNVTGFVTINVDGVNYTSPLTNGTANLTLDKLSNGTHSVVVIYEGDHNFYGNWTSATFDVSKVKPDITLHVYNTTVGQVERITVDIPENATGFVVIDVDGTKYHVNITKGQQNVVLELDKLVNKTYEITAVYSGDGYYDTANDRANFNVSKVPSDINITVSNDGIIANGSDIDITVKVPVDATGKVEIIISDGLKDTTHTIYVNDGIGTLHIETPAVGMYNVTAKYLGDEKYIGSENNTKFDVYITGKELFVDTEPVNVAQNETIEVFVSGNHTGKEVEILILNSEGGMVSKQNVTFSIYDVAGNETVAILTLDKLPAGDYTVEAFYLENAGGKVIEHTGTGNFTVSKLKSTLTIKNIKNITVGENVTIELEIDPTEATGNISVFVNGIEHITNTTSLKVVIPNLGEDEYFVHALYEGDYDHYASNATAEFKVSKVDTLIRVNATNITVGDRVLIEITSPEDLANAILVDVDGVGYYVNLTAGKAKLYIPNLASGKYNVTVRYTGDYKYGEAQNTTNFTVSKAASSVNVTADNITVGDKAIINIQTPKDLCGNVTVSVDGKNHTVFVSGGVGTLVVPDLGVGPHTVNVTFDGCKKYEPSSNSTTFNVNKVKLDENDIKVIDQGNGTVVVVVPNNATGNVTITVDGKNFTADVINGTAVVQLDNVTPGTHEVEVIYSGDGIHNATTTTANVTAPKYDSPMNITVSEIKSGENGTVTVTLPENATGTVIVTVDGKHYPAEVINGTAVVKVENLTAGNKTVVVEYSGDGNYTSGYAVGNFTVVQSPVVPDVFTVVDKGNGTVVVVLPEDAGGNVTITVDGKNFTADVVNGTAIVQLDNVTPGTHEAEVLYSGDNKYTNATKLANVTAPKYDSPMDITVSEIKSGETGTITVTLPENATGNVTVTVDGMQYPVEVVDGVAVVEVGNLTAGNKTVVVEYSGDDNYVPNYVVGNFTVVQSPVVPDVFTVVDQGNGTVVVVLPEDAGGNVTITVDGKNFTADVVNGTAIVQLDNVTPGTHEVEVIYSGDGKYTNATKLANVTAPKYDSPMNISVGEIKSGENGTITVTLPENATGTVTVSVDGKTYTADVVNGTAVVEVGNLTAGPKTVVVEYSGDGNYTSAYAVDNFTVDQSPIVPDVTVVDQGNGTIVVVVPEDAGGNVTITVDGKNYTADVVNGTAVVQLDNVTPGTHDVEVIYSGDGKYANSTSAAKITAPKYDTPIKVDAPNSLVGDKAVIIVSVPDNATDNVTIEIDGVKYTSEIKGGKAVFEIENLTAGTKTIAVEYAGDGNYVANHTTGNITISKRPSTVSATITDIDVGENVTITVSVPKDATGQVLIDIDGVGYYVNVTDGKGVAQIPRMPNGVYDVNLTYTGDDKYMPSSSSGSFNVSKVPSFVIPHAQDITVGDNEVITLTVPEDATGNVTVVIDGEEYNFNLDDGALGASNNNGKYSVAVSGGNGKLVISGLPKGEYFVSVRYNGDDKYLPSTNTTVFKVTKTDTKVDVIDQGNGTVVVNVGDNASGTVEIKLGDKTYNATVENGVAVVHLTNATPGTHDVEVIYSGDESHSGKTVKSTVTVPKLDSPISVTAQDIYVGDIETVVVTLPENATGTVTIEINGVEYSTSDIVGGKAVFNVTGLAFGDKTVSVKYSGDENYMGNYTTGQFKVEKRPSTITAFSKNIRAGKDEVITVNVPSDATGRVLVKIDGVGYYADIINGKAKIVIPNLSPGKYEVTVTYEGDDKYLESNTTTSFTVSKTSTPVKATGDEIHEGEDATVVIKLPSDATGTVTIVVDGKKYTTDVIKGQAVFVIPGLAKGTYTVPVYYSGDDKYDANESTVIIKVDSRGSDGDGGNEPSQEGISLSSYSTGNPIWILLLIALAIVSTRIRRFRK